MASGDARYSVQCACSRIQLEVKGKPLVQLFCHCKSCTKFHQTAPVPFAMYPADAVTIVKGSDCIKRHNMRKAESGRYFCQDCGFKLFHQPDGVPFKGMPAHNLDGLEFQPQFHVHCGDATMASLRPFQDDGLPKFRENANDMGGSDEQVEVS